MNTKKCESCGGTFHRAKRKSIKVFSARKFCSRACAAKGMRRPARGRLTHCKSGEHEMTGDNVRVDKDGKHSCKACARKRDQERRARQPVRKRRRPARKKPVRRTPLTVATPTPVTPQRPVWRPPGWSPTPNVGRRAS